MHYFKKSLPYFATPLLALLIFFYYFNLWHADLNMPLFNNYQNDVLLHAFFAKNIIDNGWFLVNNYVGMPQLEGAFYLYDFPLEGSSFNLLIFKFFAIFTNNPFLILNLYFFTTILLVALFTFIALRNFGISVFSAIIIAILYDFTFYHISRAIEHAFLSNYSLIPLIVMVGNWLINNQIKILDLNAKNQLCLKPNRQFFILLVLGALIAANDVYYAVYSCIFLGMCLFINILREEKILNQNYVNLFFYCLIVFTTLIILYLPSLNYWMANGGNVDAAIRQYHESEYYALRIIDLLIPNANHYLDYFANTRQFFNQEISGPNFERKSESLGILASIGFLFLILWTFASALTQSKILKKTINKLSLKTKEISLFSNLGVLNFSLILFSTAGGFVMLMIPFFSLLRSHARFSIFIAFISLLVIAIIFDKFLQKDISLKKIYRHLIILIIALLAIFDQLGNPQALQFTNSNLEQSYISDKNFIAEIEEKILPQSNIFVFPSGKFPEDSDYRNLAGYLHAKNLNWSFPAMRGRPSSLWQNEVEKLEFSEFIAALKEQGFNGILINRRDLTKNFLKKNWNNLRNYQPQKARENVYEFETKLGKIAKLKLVSQDNNFSFYEL